MLKETHSMHLFCVRVNLLQELTELFVRTRNGTTVISKELQNGSLQSTMKARNSN